MAVRAVRRGDHVLGSKRSADTGRDRLLADADVQEARELTGAETLLHLLLEAADQQHLAEELAEALVGQSALLAGFVLDLRHDGLHYADARMRLVEQWRRTLKELPPDWAEVSLALLVLRDDQRSAAAALLGPASPGFAGDELRLSVQHAGGVSPQRFAKLLAKLDDERIRGTLRVLDTAAAAPHVERPRESLAAAWAEALETLPADWSDLYCELELTSSDHLDGAALRLAPLNPARVPGRVALRFRVAHRFGYGASPEMTARCLARLDEAGIPGRPKILRILSDTHNVATQGPVWRVEGRAV